MTSVASLKIFIAKCESDRRRKGKAHATSKHKSCSQQTKLSGNDSLDFDPLATHRPQERRHIFPDSGVVGVEEVQEEE